MSFNLGFCGSFLTLLLTAIPFAGQAQERPVSPGELFTAYNHWQGRQVTLAAYPALVISPANWPDRLMTFGAQPRLKSPALVVCETLTPPAGKIASTDAVVFRGTFSRRKAAPSGALQHQIALTTCDILSVGEPMPEGGDPWEPGDKPVAIEAFHDAVFEPIGKTVRVKGYFRGSSWSGASNRTRHDLKDSSSSNGRPPVSCFQEGKTKAPQSVLDDRETALVEGQIELTALSRTDHVGIVNCRFVTGQ